MGERQSSTYSKECKKKQQKQLKCKNEVFTSPINKACTNIAYKPFRFSTSNTTEIERQDSKKKQKKERGHLKNSTSSGLKVTR